MQSSWRKSPSISDDLAKLGEVIVYMRIIFCVSAVTRFRIYSCHGRSKSIELWSKGCTKLADGRSGRFEAAGAPLMPSGKTRSQIRHLEQGTRGELHQDALQVCAHHAEFFH